MPHPLALAGAGGCGTVFRHWRGAPKSWRPHAYQATTRGSEVRPSSTLPRGTCAICPGFRPSRSDLVGINRQRNRQQEIPLIHEGAATPGGIRLPKTNLVRIVGGTAPRWHDHRGPAAVGHASGGGAPAAPAHRQRGAQNPTSVRSRPCTPHAAHSWPRGLTQQSIDWFLCGETGRGQPLSHRDARERGSPSGSASSLLAQRPPPGPNASGAALEVRRRLTEEMPEEPHVGFRVLIHLGALDTAEERRALVGPDGHPR